MDELAERAASCETAVTIDAQFARHVTATPQAAALIADECSISYRELDARANRRARRLIASGLRPGAHAALLLDRSPDLIVSILAVLKAGAVYVPLDADAPVDRLSWLLDDLSPAVIIVDTANAGRHRWPQPPVVIEPSEDDAAWSDDDVPLFDGPDEVAYVMYTSGSTGRPKGVQVTHRGVARLVNGLHQIALDRSARLLQISPASFDASTFEIWGALLHGASCVVFPPGAPSAAELGAWLRRHQITTLLLTSAFFNAIVDEAPATLATVRQLLVGGEALSVTHVRRAQAALPGTALFNAYGPTEATTVTLCYAIPRPFPDGTLSVPLGWPLSNTQVYVLDSHLSPVPAGAEGELHIGGDGLARGYLNQPALTAERFVPNPFGPPGSRLYRTGDRARHLRDGAIEFLGRRDGQIKLRGFRIELGEIEEAIRRQASVRDVAVVVHEGADREKRLAAYVVFDGTAAANTDRLRQALRLTLPDYMLPTWLLPVTALPLTANGKLDRRALPAPDSSGTPGDGSTMTAPVNGLEAAVAGIWREVLGVAAPGMNDNFFDSGGHSLLAMKLVGRIRSELDVVLPLRALFEQPTLAGLVEAVTAQSSKDMQDRRSASPWRYLFDLNPGRGTTPVFFVPGGTGGDHEFLVYARLVHHVDGTFKFLGLRAISADGITPAQRTVESMAADYVGEIVKVHPGPYRLVGNCIGGVVAFEVARQLRQRGFEIKALVLMDTDFPNQRRYARYRWMRIGAYFEGRLELLQYYSRRLAHHRHELKTRTWTDRLRYLAGRTRTVVRDAVELQDGMDLRVTVRETYEKTLRRYRPHPYEGPVTLIVSEESNAGRAIPGWSGMVRGEVTVLHAPGDHDAYIRDHVKTVAEQLRRCLEDET